MKKSCAASALKTARMSFVVTEAIRDKIKQVARDAGMLVSVWIHKAVEHAIKRGFEND